MYNQLFIYLSENSIIYEKQIGFQTSHSIEHAILLLVNQLYQLFNESKFTLGIFIDLRKAFDTVDHKFVTILKKKKILKKQKYAARITFHANRLDHVRPLLKKMKALNVYQINVIPTLKFMHKTNNGINP